ncbi:Protein of unknown function wound-induced [Macleaya cordata]|uniref:Wound-responsive family protein n=1 Tax=Macleaya cordata TaxID=56857 RepID=A0A200Q5E4_MACCD|nr:Protein of unknown function wound-induced [Macleaya cordata]OVA07993.1 Protein of unknown function wound-induced [Macleaya cordata]
MSSTSRAWMVAGTVGAVEVLKDQVGICRWNYAIHQHTKNPVRSFSQANRVLSCPSSSSSSVIPEKILKRDGEEKMKQSEESLRKVMYLSCWGPN